MIIAEPRGEDKLVDISNAKYAPGEKLFWCGESGSQAVTITGVAGEADGEIYYYGVDDEDNGGKVGIPESQLYTEAELQSAATVELSVAALEYAAMGWKIFPVYPLDKNPIGAYVPNGFKDATTDADTIRDWWKREPKANIGLWCAASGIIALDADPHKFGPGDARASQKSG